MYPADINECEEEIDTCVQDCTDTEGGYNCSCGSGYTLANDSFGCDGTLQKIDCCIDSQ